MIIYFSLTYLNNNNIILNNNNKHNIMDDYFESLRERIENYLKNNGIGNNKLDDLLNDSNDNLTNKKNKEIFRTLKSDLIDWLGRKRK